MSMNTKKISSDINSIVVDNDVGQFNEDTATARPSLSCSTSSSPQASPKLVHRNRGSKSNSPGSSVTTTISEELALTERNADNPSDVSCLLDREDAISRSSESNKSVDISMRTPDSSSFRDVSRDKKSSDKKRKTTSWYNVLNPTYKSKTEDFKRLFKDLPETERLIVDYSCALQKDILVHGRLYISQNFICFYANIFRWETFLTIKCKDITAMTKEKTALVIPNAIQVCTSTEKHFFTSFGARDKTYLMLFRVWQNALLEQPMSPQDIWSWIHYCYGDELGLTSDDDDYVAQSVPDEELLKGNSVEFSLSDGIRKSVNPSDLFAGSRINESPSDNLDTSFLNSGLITSSSPSLTSPHILNGSGDFIEEANEGDDDDDDDDDEEEYNTDDDDDERNCTEAMLKSSIGGLVNGVNGIPHAGNVNGTINGNGNGTRSISGSDTQVVTDLNKLTPTMSKASPESPLLKEPSESSDMDEFEVQCPCESHEGKEMISRVIPFSVDQALQMLFSDSKFFNDFHLSRKTTDMIHSDWQDHEAGKIRQVTYTLALNLPVGPKTAQTTETQIMHKYSNPGKLYCIEVDAITTGVPYCDAFFTHHQHCLTRVSNNECRVKIHSQIKYKKSVWNLVKSVIERNTWTGLDDFFKGMDVALVKESNVALPNQSAKQKKPRRPRRPSDKFKIKIENSGALETPETQQPWRIPISSHKDTARSAGSDVLVPIILLVLILLLILNALLYYKLWALEASTNRNVFPSFVIDADLLRTPKTNDDWLRLVHQQEALHQAEVTKWREVIDTVVSVLRETEDSLVSLRQSMYSRSHYTSTSSSEAQDNSFGCQTCQKT